MSWFGKRKIIPDFEPITVMEWEAEMSVEDLVAAMTKILNVTPNEFVDDEWVEPTEEEMFGDLSCRIFDHINIVQQFKDFLTDNEQILTTQVGCAAVEMVSSVVSLFLQKLVFADYELHRSEVS